MTRTDTARRVAAWLVAPLCLMVQTACSDAASAPERTATAGTAGPAERAATTAPAPAPIAEASDLRPTGAPAPAPASDAGQTASRVLGKHDRTVSGKQTCDVDFVYAGREPEDLFWEEPCAAVTAKMVTRADLESLGRWSRLDEFQRKFVADMPGGRVLYVEGGFSASVYPIDETGTSIEVAVAD